MKKTKLFIGLLLVLGLFILVINIDSQEIIAKQDKVDKEVKEKLKKQPKVRVIVTLKDYKDKKDKKEKKTKEKLEKDKEKNKQLEDQVLSQLSGDEFDVIYQYNYVSGFAGFVSQEGLNKLENDPNVYKIGIDEKIFHQQLTEAGPLINSTTVHTAGHNGTGQVVCILDSGVNYNHTNLGGGSFPNSKVIDGWDYASDPDDSDPLDDQHHGTYVSGIVAADNTGGNTYLGIAPDSDIVAMKVLDSGGNGSPADVYAAVDDCIDLKLRDTDPLNIVALNLSLGDNAQWNVITGPSGCETAFESTGLPDIFAVAKSADIALFAASGNQSYSDGINYPACDSSIISVGSVNDTSPYAVVNGSNSDEILDILAPGNSIVSTEGSGFGDGGLLVEPYVGRSGTSYASPMAAGAAALMTDENDSLTPEQIRCALVETGIDTPDTGTGPNKPRIDINTAINFNPTITGNTSWTGGYLLYKNTSTAVTSGTAVPMGEDLLVKDGSDNILASVDVDCNANLGTDVSMGQNFGTNKAFIHNLANKANVGNVSLYIPKGIGDNSVWMCPGASSESEVNAACAGGFSLSSSNPDNGSYHLVTSDPTYWIVEGIENTGGFSQQEDTAIPQLPKSLIWKIIIVLISVGAAIGIATYWQKRKNPSKKSGHKK